MTKYDTSTIHRYLDGAFADIPLTPDVQDLKEEIRGNLAARVTELEASGLKETAASRKAIKELGDIREIITQLGAEKDAAPNPLVAVAAAHARNKVRLRPAYVVRTTVLSLAAVFGVVVVVLAVVGIGDSGRLFAAIPAACTLAVPVGMLVGDGLRQETTANHPLPTWRAVGYGLATSLCVGGLALVAQYMTKSSHDWLVMTGVPLIVVAVVMYSYLGATQTNRKKPWAKETAERMASTPENRLENDPAAAARFGLLSGALWISAIVAFVVLSIQIGFAWSWLAFLGAILLQMVLVATIVFGEDDSVGEKDAP